MAVGDRELTYISDYRDGMSKKKKKLDRVRLIYFNYCCSFIYTFFNSKIGLKGAKTPLKIAQIKNKISCF